MGAASSCVESDRSGGERADASVTWRFVEG